ncbi:fimbrial protein [Pseudomonas sp. BN417]|uniref:fimbrial protein n=1 Tax=Pseudomonas sp. BN417 TaxID=2567890 RepID=UPI002457B671|nr:fimbrial protein [Pseudomonas sp. BN417]MDH4556448.1 fimbrial protein [Pseudomonas sp. BN417]
MKNMIRLVFLGLMLALAQKSFALACLKDTSKNGWQITGEVSDTAYIDTTIAVSNTLPKNTVLWRSPEYSISITCWQDRSASGEYVYFYLSPDDPGYTKLGPDLELGIRLDGHDYYCDNGMERFQGRCRKKLEYFYFYCGTNTAPGGNGCPDKAITKQLSYSFFVSKRSAPSTGKEGKLTGVVGAYGAFQLDGVGGMNDHLDKNFRMYVNGLSNMRYIACGATLSISPETVYFGHIHPSLAEAGKEIKELPLTITVNKPCSSVYGLGAQLTPINAKAKDGYTLIPNDNSSVGIQLFRKETLARIPFNKEFLLMANTASNGQIPQNFLARLKWTSNEAIIGPFNASASVDIYYK